MGIEVCTGCWWGNLKERGHWGEQDVDGRILRWIFRKLEGVVGTGWELAQDRDRWRALVDTVRNFSSSINAGNFLTSGKVYWLASQEGLCSVE
jgi:hypothetical protein